MLSHQDRVAFLDRAASALIEQNNPPAAAPRAFIGLAQPGIDLAHHFDRLSTIYPRSIRIADHQLQLLHPATANVIDANRYSIADTIRPDIERCAADLVKLASFERRDVLLQADGANPEHLLGMVEQLKARNYEIHLHAMAIKPPYSWLALHQGFEGAMREDPSAAIWTKRGYHDQAMRNLPQLLAELESGGALSRLHIFLRSGEPIYANRVLNGFWQNTPGAIAALNAEWQNAPQAHDIGSYQLGWDWVFDAMQDRNASREEWNAAQQAAAFHTGVLKTLTEANFAPSSTYQARFEPN